MTDSNIKSFIRPLILIPDTDVQNVTRYTDKSYASPSILSEQSFKTLERGLLFFGTRAQLNFLGQPAYTIFDNSLLRRFTFWKPLLSRGYPIYIVSPLFGLLWPGDKAGTYELDMNEAFMAWRQIGLWEVVDELFIINECDGVLSYLPPLYNNVVRVDDIPWVTRNFTNFKKDQRLLKQIALSTGE